MLLCGGLGLLFLFVLLGLILALIDELEDTFFVFFSELAVDFSCLLRICHDDLIDDELLDDVLVDGILLELKVVVSDRFALDDLVVVEGIIELLQEWMLEDLLGSEPFLWIVSHELADEINCSGRSSWHKLFPGLSGSLWGDLLHVFEIVLLQNLALDLLRWQAENLNKIFEEFVDCCSPHEDLFVEELGEDAPDGPHVEGGGVVFLIEQIEFRCSVVPGGDIFGQDVVLVDLSDLHVGLAEITDLDVPVLVDKDVQRLQVSVDDAFGVHVENTFEDLVGQILDVLRVHRISVVANHVHQILRAVLEDEIELIEVVWILGTHERLQLDDVPVTSEDSQEA